MGIGEEKLCDLGQDLSALAGYLTIEGLDLRHEVERHLGLYCVLNGMEGIGLQF